MSAPSFGVSPPSYQSTFARPPQLRMTQTPPQRHYLPPQQPTHPPTHPPSLPNSLPNSLPTSLPTSHPQQMSLQRNQMAMKRALIEKKKFLLEHQKRLLAQQQHQQMVAQTPQQPVNEYIQFESELINSNVAPPNVSVKPTIEFVQSPGGVSASQQRVVHSPHSYSPHPSPHPMSSPSSPSLQWTSSSSQVKQGNQLQQTNPMLNAQLSQSFQSQNRFKPSTVTRPQQPVVIPQRVVAPQQNRFQFEQFTPEQSFTVRPSIGGQSNSTSEFVRQEIRAMVTTRQQRNELDEILSFDDPNDCWLDIINTNNQQTQQQVSN